MTQRAELSIGEALVGLLEGYGVQHIFGIPGVHNIEMYRALPRSKITHILPRHEQGAGFMADGYARATGKPGVCFTITGPGLLNILTPMGQAWSDSSNLLVISTALDFHDSAQGRGRLHEMIGQLDAAKAVTAFAARAYTAQDVQDAVAGAFANFASQRPRPAYIEIPIDTLKAPAGEGWSPRALPRRPAADPRQIELAITKLKQARRPVIIVGGGALEASAASLAVAEKLRAPVITTTAGKGAFPASHPLCVGYRLSRDIMPNYLKKSDAILCVGSELSETDFWDNREPIVENLIRIDIDPKSLVRPHRAEIAILGDALQTMKAIAEGLPPRHKDMKSGFSDDEYGELQRLIPDPTYHNLVKALEVIREALPMETVVCSDMTQIAYLANQHFPVEQPRTWFHPVGFGTLGFGLPCAIGAKFAAGAAPVAAMAGDYGFQYTSNELGTAVEHKLAIPILLWNNELLGAIHDSMASAGIQPNAVTLLNPDFQMLAKAYGAKAEKPMDLKGLSLAIKTALKADRPTLIEMTPRMVGG
jgi:5-guanidino-2-oxopentanoate decarboxylase